MVAVMRPASQRGRAPDHTLVLVNGKRRRRGAVISWSGHGVTDGAQEPDILDRPRAPVAGHQGVARPSAHPVRLGRHRQGAARRMQRGTGGPYGVTANASLPLSRAGFANLSRVRRGQVHRPQGATAGAAGLIGTRNGHVWDPAEQWGAPDVHDHLKLSPTSAAVFANGVQAYGHANFARRDVLTFFYFRNPNTCGGVFSKDGGRSLLVGDVLAGRGERYRGRNVTTTAHGRGAHAPTRRRLLVPDAFAPQQNDVPSGAVPCRRRRGRLDVPTRVSPRGVTSSTEIGRASAFLPLERMAQPAFYVKACLRHETSGNECPLLALGTESVRYKLIGQFSHYPKANRPSSAKVVALPQGTPDVHKGSRRVHPVSAYAKLPPIAKRNGSSQSSGFSGGWPILKRCLPGGASIARHHPLRDIAEHVMQADTVGWESPNGCQRLRSVSAAVAASVAKIGATTVSPVSVPKALVDADVRGLRRPGTRRVLPLASAWKAVPVAGLLRQPPRVRHGVANTHTDHRLVVSPAQPGESWPPPRRRRPALSHVPQARAVTIGRPVTTLVDESLELGTSHLVS